MVSSKNPDNAGFAGIQSQKNKTGTIIRIWSRSDNAVIRQLLEALECIGRVDVAQKVAKSIEADCVYAEKSSKPDDHKTITTYNDIVCDQVSSILLFLKKGQTLQLLLIAKKKYECFSLSVLFATLI